MNRKSETLRIKNAATYYMVDKNYSVYDEVGLKSCNKSSRLRADLIGLNIKADILLIEVKSCWQDFVTDTKWENYLSFCNKMYFALSESLYESKHKDFLRKRLSEFGIGILLVNSKGNVKVVLNAKKRKVDGKTRRWLVTKLAWRGGYCKATSDRSMRFNTNLTDDNSSLLEFLTWPKSARAIYVSKYPKCGYKKYINYPILDDKFIVGSVE
jgi:hypothetical protein